MEEKKELENNILKWPTYYAVGMFKSVKRAVRRGNVDTYSGVPYPTRPFNNRKPTRGRANNEIKKSIYGQLG